MLGNLEVATRYQLGITVVHIANGGFAGYGPGFWGDGHDPYTHEVTGYNELNMSKIAAELGYLSLRIDNPDEIENALEEALIANEKGQPAYLEFICNQFPVYGGWVPAS